MQTQKSAINKLKQLYKQTTINTINTKTSTL